MPTDYLPGTEPPSHSPEIEQAIDDKAKRIAALKLAKEACQVSDAKLLELVEHRGQPYRYLDRVSGRSRVLQVSESRKLKDTAAKSQKKEQADREWEAQQAEARGGLEQDAARAGWEAEVSRRAGQRAGKADRAAEGRFSGKTATPEPESDESFARRRAVRVADDEQAERDARQAAQDADDPFAGTREAMATDGAPSETPAQAAAREASEARAARRRGAR